MLRFFYLLIGLSLVLGDDIADRQPEQIHLSLGKNPTEMVVTWVTNDALFVVPVVEYGEQFLALNMSASGYSTQFIDGGPEKRQMYIHRVLLTGLKPGNMYFYRAGSEMDWSPIFFFRAIKEGNNWSPKFAVYGDLGVKNGRSIPRLQREVESGVYDAVFHVGDFAYDMDSDNGRRGDIFMRQIEAIAGYVPYQTCVGNHEMAYNFSNYVNRFTMINKEGNINNHFYSFNIGPAHIISFSTEFYFFLEYGWSQIMVQYEWLKRDLEEANKPENRALRPWIITMGHRPMYCSTKDDDDCTQRESVVRKGIPLLHTYALEKLFYENGVDLEFWAHEHMYERLWPIYDYKVYNGSTEEPYTNPGAPVHVTAGSAGCQENLDPFVDDPATWSAKRISDYGFTRMIVQNATHLYLEQVSDETGEIVDQALIIKDHHGPYTKQQTVV